MDIGSAHAYIDIKSPFALFDGIRSGFLDGNGNFESRADTFRNGTRNLDRKGNIPPADIDLELGQQYADEYNRTHMVEQKFICAAVKLVKDGVPLCLVGANHAECFNHATDDVRERAKLRTAGHTVLGYFDESGTFTTRTDAFKYNRRNITKHGDLPTTDVNLELAQTFANACNTKPAPPTEARKLTAIGEIREYVNSVLVKE